MSITRDILSFLLRERHLPLKFIMLSQLDIEQIAKDLEKPELTSIQEIVRYIDQRSLNEKLTLAIQFNLTEEIDFLRQKGAIDVNSPSELFAWGLSQFMSNPDVLRSIGITS